MDVLGPALGGLLGSVVAGLIGSDQYTAEIISNTTYTASRDIFMIAVSGSNARWIGEAYMQEPVTAWLVPGRKIEWRYSNTAGTVIQFNADKRTFSVAGGNTTHTFYGAMALFEK